MSLRTPRSTGLRAAIVLTVVAAAGLPAAAAPADCRPLSPAAAAPVVCTEQLWFHAGPSGPVGNVGGALRIAEAGPQEPAGWDDRAPTGSSGGAALVLPPLAEDANGTNGLNVPGELRPAGSASFAGVVRGNLDALAVDVHVAVPGRTGSTPTSLPVRLDVEVDGRPWTVTRDVALRPSGATGATGVLGGLVTGLFDGRDEPGRQHQVRLLVMTAGGGDEAVVLFDRADAPSGLVVNPRDAGGRTTLAFRQ